MNDTLTTDSQDQQVETARRLYSAPQFVEQGGLEDMTAGVPGPGGGSDGSGYSTVE